MKFRLVLFLLVAAFAGCTNTKIEKKEIIRKVKVAAVETGEPILKSEFSGIIREDRENNLAFRVAGPVKAIYAKEGSFVKKGDLIAEIDPRDYQVQVDVARAQYEQVKSETGRVSEMYNRKSIAGIDYDKAVSGEKMVAAQLQHAENQLRDTKLFAPFSGYVQHINFEKGEMINAGMTFATLISLNTYKIEVDIPALLFVRRNDFTAFTCQNNESGDEELPLILTSFTMKADNNQLYKLYLNLDPQLNKKLAPGMNVKVVIYYKNQAEQSFSIPVEALFYKDGNTYVWIFNPESSVVNKRRVEPEALTGNGNIRITTGLTGNEKVVVAGVNVLKENQKVVLLETAGKTNIGGLL
ncbi:MAG: efflux transporter RND family MFP [Prolixibacteraceae bacterium]|nr:MAG: efflux transporter RND family MFP [Prolixibacteraceae bacterium]